MKRTLASLIGVLTFLLWTILAHAQEEELAITLARDWGYGGGRDIQGLFSLKASGPENLTRVEFYLDAILLAADTEPPFRVQFHTDNYPLGKHDLCAIGYTADGRQLASRVIRVNFVTPEAGRETVGKIVGPLLALVVIGILVTALLPTITSRRGKTDLAAGAPRVYPLGGGICPHCRRPFAFHIWGLNLLAGKFERCPYCGKWSLVRSLSRERLRAAERAEQERLESVQLATESEDERLKRALDESRYQNL